MTLKDMVILSRVMIQALYLDGEAGVELRFEIQESRQGTPRADIRDVQYVKKKKKRSVGASILLPTPTFLCVQFRNFVY